MAHLPLANIAHYKLRSVLSALGIGIGICMLITLSGLARGSLYEVADRWEGVDADLIAYPRIWGDNITTLSGVGLPDSEAADIVGTDPGLAERVVPAFLWRLRLAGQDHVVAGVDSDPAQWRVLTGGRGCVRGRWCDEGGRAADWLLATLLGPTGDGAEEAAPAEALTEEFLRDGLAERGGFELVIDSRLAEAGGYRVGQSVRAAEHDWKIVGIVPAGALARAFMPRRTAQLLFGGGNVKMSTLMFVKLRAGADAARAAGRLRTLGREVVPIGQYRRMLRQQFGMMFRYVDMVNAVALAIAFLFIMITLYTMVLQRTRAIAMLKACGAGRGFIVRQVLGESAILTGAGTAAGIALSFLAAWGIRTFRPLLTVTITWEWIAVAVAAAAAGAVVSALYPAWRATRVDVAAALTLE
jgi:hypothetical protein